MVGILIALQVAGLICAGVALIYYCCHRPGLCDSCKYLEKKGGGNFRYTCRKPGKCAAWFDRLPEYCASYCPRDDQTQMGLYDRPDIVDAILRTRTEPHKCTICGRGKINFIAGLNITSEHATYDLGMFEPKYCPLCGKKL